jgi:hypothetical protein
MRHEEGGDNGWRVEILDAVVLGLFMNRGPQVRHRGNRFVARHADGRKDSHDAR